MKKVLTSFAIAVSMLGMFGVSTVVKADTTDNTQVNATTNATVSFKSGTLSLSNVQNQAAFNTTTTAFSAATIWQSGLASTPADTKMTATVDDFLGGDSDAWTLSVAKGTWKASDGKAAPELDKGAHLSIDKDNEITTAGYSYATGKYGHNVIAEHSLDLKIDSGTLVNPGTYSNTLTWTLSDPASKTAN